MLQKILFIDRDGTLVEEPFDCQVDSLEKIKLVQGVIPVLLALQKANFKFIMVTNQNGIGTPFFPEEKFLLCHRFILDLFSSQGIVFDSIFICPHLPEDQCNCRKPKTGLLDEWLRLNPLDKESAWVIGDRETDKLLADNLGIAYLPVSNEHGWDKISSCLLNKERSAQIKRTTRETDITLQLNLDSDKSSRIQTPLPFFSHMLEQVAQHAGFCMQLEAAGDVDVDDHHLIEDTAIALGQAIREALGDKWGIGRYGFTLPMDESLASIAIDISGRSYSVFKSQFTREFVGGLATEMIPHFFQSLSSSLGASIHVQVEGSNHHHMIEACFKALGRVLGQACSKQNASLPSTKGVLT